MQIEKTQFRKIVESLKEKIKADLLSSGVSDVQDITVTLNANVEVSLFIELEESA